MSIVVLCDHYYQFQDLVSEFVIIIILSVILSQQIQYFLSL